MNKLTNLWSFLDGKKTNIGAAIILLSKVLDLVPQTKQYSIPVETIGEAVAGLGLTHKFLK